MMSKIILVEGPDRCGKSTQIRNIHGILSESAPTHVIKCSNIPNKTPEEARHLSEIYYRDLLSLCEWAYQGDSNLILDRSWIGEMVYAPIFRNYCGDYVIDIEKEFIHRSFWPDLSLITFVDKPENLIARDDGLSFSIDEDVKRREVEAFKIAHRKSLIEAKFLLSIERLPEQDVWEEVKAFLGV